MDEKEPCFETITKKCNSMNEMLILLF